VPMRRLLFLLCAVGTTVALSACSSGSSSTGASPAATRRAASPTTRKSASPTTQPLTANGLVFNERIAATGAVTLAATYTRRISLYEINRPKTSCANYARLGTLTTGEPQLVFIAQGPLVPGLPLGGHMMAWYMWADPSPGHFRGPGTFTGSAIEPVVQVDGVVYMSQTSTVQKMIVKKDSSGSYHAVGLVSPDGAKTIGLDLSWTCTDSKTLIQPPPA
jgi:hypothetical protein